MRYKNTKKDIREISKELGVEYVLEGSVRKSGKRVRITAQLIEARGGTHLWADDYDRDFSDIFAIQDDVTRAIADALEASFTNEAARMVESSRPGDVEAYDAHLNARYFIDNVYMKTKKDEDYREAMRLVNRTIALAPDQYIGYYDMAYLREMHFTISSDPADISRQKVLIWKAYRLNPRLPETNAALGYTYSRAAEYDSAFVFLKKALELQPNSWESLHLIALNFSYVGLHKRAIRFYDKAAELNPFSIFTLSNRGASWMIIGETDKALLDLEKSCRIDPTYAYGMYSYAIALIMKKRYSEADSMLKLLEKNPAASKAGIGASGRAVYLAAIGEREEALALSKEGGDQRIVPVVFSLLGMKKEAIDAIEERLRMKRAWHFWTSYLALANHPFYDNLRGEPRFEKMLERLEAEYERKLVKYRLGEEGPSS